VAVGNFDLKIPTENIPSVNPLVFSEFLVVFILNAFVDLIFGLRKNRDTDHGILQLQDQEGRNWKI